MATAGDVVSAALRELGVLAAGETATADDSADGLSALNRLIDQWAAERLRIYTVTRTVWTLTSGTGQYAVGPGLAVNVVRPVYVDHVNFQDTSTSPDTEYPLDKLTEDAWAGIRYKAQTSTFPTSWYYNPTYTAGALDLWPVPTSTTLQGVLYAPAAVAQFAALTTAVSLPPGYEEMLVTALAIRLSPSYGRRVSPELREAAQEAEAVVKRANVRLSDLSVDAGALIQGGRGSYDIRRG
jgi:hypothetical protein